MSRRMVILGAASLIMISGAVVHGDVTIIFEENFDSYPEGQLPGQGNWTGFNSQVLDQQSSGFVPCTPPHVAYIGAATVGDATWEITAPGNMIGLTLEFHAEFQPNSNPHLYLSSDGVAWTEITSEFGITKVCNNDLSPFFFADLAPYLQPAGVQETVFLRWANENPVLPNCYVIGFDCVKATVTMAESESACSGYQGVECDPDYCANLLRPLGVEDCPVLTVARGDHVGFAEWSMPVAASAGSEVGAAATWCYVDDGGLNPNAVTYVTVFGDWQPDSPLGVLVNGELMGPPRTVTEAFSFTAPETPGIYRIRWNLVEAFAPVDSFCSHPDNGVNDPGCGRYAEIPLVVCGPNADLDCDRDLDLMGFGLFAESFDDGGGPG